MMAVSRFRWDPRLVELLHRRPELCGVGISAIAYVAVA